MPESTDGMNFGNRDEAEQTVRKKNGEYCDLAKESLLRESKTSLSGHEFMNLMGKLRLRFTLTPSCNIFCTFCSNEGSNYTAKGLNHSNIDLVTTLSDILLENTPIHMIDFSGGEPTIHPDFTNREYRLIEWTKRYPYVRFSLHSNGIKLVPELIDKIYENFSRIGFSIHSMNFDTWNRITNLRDRFTTESQKRKFDQMMFNLSYLSERNIGDKVFLKMVVMRGVNDSKKELTDFLGACDKYGFHPKFLEFEAQYPSQRFLEVGRRELFNKLEKLGCIFEGNIPMDESKNHYFPNVNFRYKNAKMGLQSRFGCGETGACLACYDYLCIFVKPSENGRGLYLKPCSVLDTRFDLTPSILNRDEKQILQLFKMSREYLMLAPGLNVDGWNKEKEYE